MTWGIPNNAAMPLDERRANGAYRDYALSMWQDAQKTLEAAKAKEMEWRKEVIDIFSDRAGEAMASGMENVATSFGTLKIEHKLTYKLGNVDLVDKALDAIEKSQEGGNVIAERLVSWKPELSVREYKLLSAVQQKIIDEVLTISPAAKSIKLEPVKGK